jgi:pimeloyl-ACP methyl ester carboxylesterase
MKESIFDNKIYYRTNEFKEDRLTIVFVHGVCGSSSAWWEYEKILNDKYNILAFDIRGHGKSKRFKEYDDYKIENFSNDLFELVNYLNIKKFVIISHSFGAFISLDFISKHKESISAAIFLSPHYNPSLMTPSKISKPFLDLISKINFPVSNTKVRLHLDYLRDYPNSGDMDIRRTIADISNTSLRVYLYTMKQSFSFNGEDILSKINFPVLIIHGKKDSLFPIKYGTIMSKKIPNSKIVKLENVSHEIKDSLLTIDKISNEMLIFLKDIK